MTDSSTPSLFTRFKTAYAEQKGGKRALPVWSVVLIGLLAPAGVSAYRAWRNEGSDQARAISFVPGTLPACNSGTARQLLTSTLAEAPAAKEADVKLIKLGDVRETGFVPVNAKGSSMRLCSADAFLNVGRRDVSFTLEWTSAAKDELWIEMDASF